MCGVIGVHCLPVRAHPGSGWMPYRGIGWERERENASIERHRIRRRQIALHMLNLLHNLGFFVLEKEYIQCFGEKLNWSE